MPELFYDLLKQKMQAREAEMGISTENAEKADVDRKRIKNAEEALYKMLMGERSSVGVPFKEAITSRDFPALMQRVLNDRILLPAEPDYIGQSLLATVVQVGRSLGSYQMPALGYLEAKEIGETQDYPEQTLEMNRNATSIALKKFGIRISCTEEMVEADDLGLFGLHVQAAKIAMNRKKEEVIFALFKNVVTPVFDNSIAFGSELTTKKFGESLTQPTDADDKMYATTGKDFNGDLNATLHVFDLIDVFAALLARGYAPTDILMNPLAWTILARNPILNGFHMYGGMVDQDPRNLAMYTATGPQNGFNVRTPWSATIHVTPFVSVTTQVDGLGDSIPYLTDIYVGSRRNGVLLLQGRALQQESYNDVPREILNIRLKEYYGVGLADMGRSWASMKNVRIDNSYEVPVVKTIVS